MLDIRLLREQSEKIQSALTRKGIPDNTVARLLEIDEKRREFMVHCDEFRSRQNAENKRIPTLFGAEKELALAEMKMVSASLKKAEEELRAVQSFYDDLLNTLPNPPFSDVPDGGEEDFVVMKEWGDIPEFSFSPKEHWEIAERLGILDMERGAKVSGSRFYFLREELAILQMALMNWAFLEIQKLGFSPTIPPFLTRKEAIFGTGYLQKDENYVVNPGVDDLYLIGTSEVPLASYYAGEILEEEEMPKKFAGYSPCFRREAGSYGKDTKGILRVHQFEKIEMVALCLPEESFSIHEQMREAEETLLQKLGIPYRLVLIAAGDLGSSAAKKYDIEAWLPGQGRYREVTSTSNCTDFQARRLNIRIRQKNGEIVMAHTLNGTAVSSRPLVAILENFQHEDGSVDIPKVLHPFTGGLTRISLKK
ncbi:serine--tRNA ligase [Candidatus Peregrinibacteria bacterium]|nr:MAG: serine--tRNA ligase [Candidatus Peregrinibacteria bacterium]